MKKKYNVWLLGVALFLPAVEAAAITVSVTTTLGCEIEMDFMTPISTPPSGFDFAPGTPSSGGSGEIWTFESLPSSVWTYQNPGETVCPANGTDVGTDPISFPGNFLTTCTGFTPPGVILSSAVPTTVTGSSSIVQSCTEPFVEEPPLEEEQEEPAPAPAVLPAAPEPDPEPRVGNAKGLITNNPLLNPGDANFSLGSAIENLCPQLAFVNDPRTAGGLTSKQSDLLQRCSDILREGDDPTQVFGLKNMSAEELNATSTNARRSGRLQLGNVASRLAALRPAIAQTSRDTAYYEPIHPVPGLLGYATPEDEDEGITHPGLQRGGAAGDDDGPLEGGRWGIFVSGLIADGDRDSTNFASGYDYSSNGYTVGVDYLLSTTAVVGVALGYGSSESEFQNNEGVLDVDTTTVTVYGTRQLNEDWYIDGVVGFGNGDYTNVRNLDYAASGTGVNTQAISETDSDQTLFSIGFGRSYYRDDLSFDLVGRINRLNTEVGRFVENVPGDGPGNGLALEIDSQDIKSTSSDITLRASKSVSTQWGVFIPSGSLTWFHEFEDGDATMRARFLNDPFSENFVQSGLAEPGGGGITTFNIPIDPVDKNYGIVGLGSTLLYPNGWSLNLGLNTVVGFEHTSHIYYTLGLRKDLE